MFDPSTYTLLDGLNVIMADANSSHAAKMPASLPFSILDHYAREYNQLRVNAVKDAMV